MRRVIPRLEMVDHDLGDRHQWQRQRQAPDPEHDAEQDLEREQRGRRNVECLPLEDRRQHIALQRVHAEEQDERADSAATHPEARLASTTIDAGDDGADGRDEGEQAGLDAQDERAWMPMSASPIQVTTKTASHRDDLRDQPALQRLADADR